MFVAEFWFSSPSFGGVGSAVYHLSTFDVTRPTTTVTMLMPML